MTQSDRTQQLREHLVTSEWLVENLNAPDLRILDARLPDAYADGHIPGAFYVDLKRLRYNRDGVEGLLIEPEAFAAIAGQLGIDRETQVVIYDDYFSQLAARVAWSLLYYGHSAVALLDGGWDSWEIAGLPISSEIRQLSPTHFEIAPNPNVSAEYDWIQEHSRNLDVVLLDVRSQAEFDKGHLPDATLWNWENGISDERSFRDAEAIRVELKQLGVTPDKEIVTYCQSGMRAAHTFFLLRHLGFGRVRMYDGSWAEWSKKKGD